MTGQLTGLASGDVIVKKDSIEMMIIILHLLLSYLVTILVTLFNPCT